MFTAPPPTGPEFPFEGDDELLATVDQNTMDVSLKCVDEGNKRDEDRFKWYRNGTELDMPMSPECLSVERDGMGSGFYCCRFFNGSSQPEESVFNTYCVTLVFRGELNHLLIHLLTHSLSLSHTLSQFKHTLSHIYSIANVCCP